MKIRTQFIFTMALFGIMLLAAAAVVFVTGRRVAHLNGQIGIVHRIERGTSDLSYLSNDYLLFHESQQRTRWQTKFASFSADLALLDPDGLEERAITDNIRGSRQRLLAVFEDVADTLADMPEPHDAAAVHAVMQVSWSRMAVQNQGMIFDAHRLEGLMRARIDRLIRQRNLFISALLVIFSAYFLVNYLLVFRRTLKSISDLQVGMRIIGAGNLDFVIPVDRKDEIGDLSQAFNRMTSDLKTVTASKADLEREIAERRKAEDALRQQREWLRVTLGSIGDAVFATDTNARITFMNPVAEDLTGWTQPEALQKPVKEVFKIINEQTRREADNPVARVLQEGKIVGLANHTVLVRKDGAEIAIDDSAAPIKDGDGRIIGVVLVFRDVTEKRRAQAALLEAADRFRIVADFTYNWEYWRSPDNRLLYVSPSCERITGYTREEFIQDPGLLTRIVHPDDRERVATHMREDLLHSGSCALEFRIVRRNGEERWISHTCQAVVTAQGRPMGRRSSNHDITGRRHAENALRNSEQRYRSLFETMNEGFALHEILCDPEGRPCDYRFMEVNPAFEVQTGLKADNLIGRTLLEALPDTEHYWIDRYGQVALTGKSDRFENWSKPLGRCFEVSAFQTEPGRFATVFLDITERKRAEGALRDGEARFRLLSKTAGRLLATNDPRETADELCREVMAYLDCQTFFIFLVDEAAGRLHLNTCAGIPDEMVQKIEWLDYEGTVSGCAARDGERIIAENIGDTPDPRTERVASFGIRAYACHPLIAHDRVIGTLSFGTRTRSLFQPEELALMKTVADQVATAMDRRRILHELRRSRDILEMRVQERTVELEKRARQLSLLASELTLVEDRERRRLAGILHDNLQQLLVAAKMNIEILTNSIATDQRPAVESILDLIIQSISVSRSLTDELSPPLMKNYGLAASLKWLGRWVHEMHGLKIDLSVDPSLDPKQMDHTVLLFQSVRELLFNVVKHSGVKTARVEMRKDEDGCHRIIVSDRGTGLDQKIIWENADAGTGFGLFSIRERMMLMGGRLEVESRPGMGASFSLVLPPGKEQSSESVSTEIMANPAKTDFRQPDTFTIGDKIRVMLVDDHEVVRNGLSTLLGIIPDIEVVGESSDGEAAVRMARKILPDVILMDINMPKMNGLEATRLIHSEFPQIRIIILSMYEDHDDAAAALSAGASVFLTKSGSTDKLLAAIRNKDE